MTASTLTFISAGVLARAPVRRRSYELAHYTHHTFLGLFLVVLWHAEGSWKVRGCIVRARESTTQEAASKFGCLPSYSTAFPASPLQYLISGMLLWVADHAVRVARASSMVQVQGACLKAGGEVVELSYLIQGGGSWNLTDPRELSPFQHGMGQYVFLNVPAISHFEWHPFSISSVADDPVTTHHIKSHGPHSFTGKLKALVAAVSAVEANSGPESAAGDGEEAGEERVKQEKKLSEIGLPQLRSIKDLHINVEGPYGVPLEYLRYEKIVMVAGGIGITPLHSCFRTLYGFAKAGLLPVTRIHLVWVTRNPLYFEMHRSTFDTVAADSLHTRFKFSFYCTEDEDFVRPPQSPGSPLPLPYTMGRPDLRKELIGLAAYGMHALVYASGPKSLQDECREHAAKGGVDFRSESFAI